MIFPRLTQAKHLSNYSVRLSLSLYKRMETSIHTVDLFKIPDVNQLLKRRHRAPAFKTIFNKEFGLVRNQHQFPSRRINFIPRTYIVRPKTCYCQKQSSQDPIFPSHARDQSFTRVAQNETKYQKILDAVDFASRDNS